jgi:hypothetical protein
MEFYLVSKKNGILSFADKWMELENIILSEVGQTQKACSPSYADCRPKTNKAILRDTGHTKGRPCKGSIGQGKESINLNVVDVLTEQKRIQKF